MQQGVQKALVAVHSPARAGAAGWLSNRQDDAGEVQGFHVRIGKRSHVFLARSICFKLQWLKKKSWRLWPVRGSLPLQPFLLMQSLEGKKEKKEKRMGGGNELQ